MDKKKYLISIKNDIQTILNLINPYNFEKFHKCLNKVHQSIESIEDCEYWKWKIYLSNLEYFYYYFYQEEQNQFLIQNKIFVYLENIISNIYYYNHALKDYSTLPQSLSLELDSILLDTPDIVKANCIYSLLLQYYTLWTNKLDEEFITTIDEVIKEQCRKSPEQFFENVKFILETYKPIYNLETRNHFIGTDNQGVICYSSIFNRKQIDVFKSSFRLNELMCVMFKSRYNDEQKYVIPEFVNFVDDILINEIIFYTCSLYDILILYHHQIYTTTQNISNDKEYMIEITNDGKDITITKGAETITIEHFINTFDLSKIRQVYFNISSIDNSSWDNRKKELIKNIYDRVIVPLIQHKTKEEIKSINVLSIDIVNFIIKDYI